jgi:hypothetical protein
MTDNFAEGLIARLQQCLVEQTETQEDDTASLTPLHKRLQRLLDTIPSSEQRKGLSLLDLQSCLRGRKGGLPHIGELGAAMRRLGWQRQRAWSNEKSAFSSKWYPAELD